MCESENRTCYTEADSSNNSSSFFLLNILRLPIQIVILPSSAWESIFNLPTPIPVQADASSNVRQVFNQTGTIFSFSLLFMRHPLVFRNITQVGISVLADAILARFVKGAANAIENIVQSFLIHQRIKDDFFDCDILG